MENTTYVAFLVAYVHGGHVHTYFCTFNVIFYIGCSDHRELHSSPSHRSAELSESKSTLDPLGAYPYLCARSDGRCGGRERGCRGAGERQQRRAGGAVDVLELMDARGLLQHIILSWIIDQNTDIHPLHHLEYLIPECKTIKWSPKSIAKRPRMPFQTIMLKNCEISIFRQLQITG